MKNIDYDYKEELRQAVSPENPADEEQKVIERIGVKSIVKVSAIAVAAVLLLIFGTISWFTMNREVENSGLQMTAEGAGFELAVTGDDIGAISYVGSGTNPAAYTGTALNDFLTGANAPDGQSGTYTTISNSSGTFYTTGGSDEVIKWRLANAYNRYDDGLGPDSQGSFTFYVVPKVNGSLRVKISLDLEVLLCQDLAQNKMRKKAANGQC